MKIFVVSMLESALRRLELERQFPIYSKNFEYIDAIVGRELKAQEYYEYLKSAPQLLSPGEMGCRLSHINAWKEFLDSDLEYALFLEDDVLGCDNDLDFIYNIVKKIDSKSMLICGGQVDEGCKHYLFGKQIVGKLHLLSSFSKSYVYGTVCYVLTRSAAAWLLNYQKNNSVVADSWSAYAKNSQFDIYYADILQHPRDLNQSTISSNIKRGNIAPQPLFARVKKGICWRIQYIYTILKYCRIH